MGKSKKENLDTLVKPKGSLKQSKKLTKENKI